MKSFFGVEFWRDLTIRGILMLVLVVVSLYVGSTLQQITTLLESVDRTMGSIERLIAVDPEKIKIISSTISDGSKLVGEGVGEGGATTVDKIGTALEKFRKKPEGN